MKYLMSAIEYTVIIALLHLLVGKKGIFYEMQYKFCYSYSFNNVLLIVVDSRTEEKVMEVSMNNDCICSGDTVTYECTVVGDNGGITVWMGDFFRCPNSKREIGLLHSDFTSVQGGGAYSIWTCNNGNVVERIVRAENGRYTSQLNVTLTSDIIGQSIECAYDNGTIHRVGSLCVTAG